MVCLLAMVYLYAIKSSCQADVGQFIVNLSNLIFFRVSGDIYCLYPFCKRRFQSQYKFTPLAVKQHWENPGNWHEIKGNTNNYKSST